MAKLLAPGANFSKLPLDIHLLNPSLLYRFSGMGLRLANLTGTALLLLNGSGEISGTTNYTLTQKWSRAVYDHPQQVDGLLYMSRRVNDSVAVVLFERDPKKAAVLKASTPVRLSEHPEFAASAKQLRLGGI